MASLTPAQQRILRVLAVYDRDGAEDPIRYDTRDARTIRTLRALARRGLVVVSQDADEDGRLYAALPAAD
jgi:hypothetical protein